MNVIFKKELVFFDIDSNNRTELFSSISSELLQRDLVTTEYEGALNEREDSFPTGLRTKRKDIAIPHTDPQYIKEAFIAIVKPKHSIRMLQMGDNTELDSELFLFLGIKNPKEQVPMLASLMELFRDDAFLDKLDSADTEEKLFELFNNNFRK